MRTIGSLVGCLATRAPRRSRTVARAALVLHEFRVQVDVAVVVVVLAWANLLAHFTTPWAGVVTVPAVAVGLIAWLRISGLGCSELGLGREHWRSGAAYAVGAVALVVAVIAIGAMLPWTRPMFMNHRYATISGALVASMLIIPLQTVIPEELAFRGVLHGALNRAWGFRGVAFAGSLLFGLWHVATSLGLTTSNVGLTRLSAAEPPGCWPGSCWRWSRPRLPGLCSVGYGDAAAACWHPSDCTRR